MMKTRKEILARIIELVAIKASETPLNPTHLSGADFDAKIAQLNRLKGSISALEWVLGAKEVGRG